jgi:methylmalonyl-CoA mutase
MPPSSAYKSAMTAASSLAGDFPRVSEEDWRKLAERPDGRKAMSPSASDDGIAIGPIYPQTDPGSRAAGREPGTAWTIIQRIDRQELIDAVTDDLAGGAGGVALVFRSSPNAHGASLTDVSVPRLDGRTGGTVAVHIDAGEATRAIAAPLAGRSDIELVLADDPLATMAARGRADRAIDDLLGECADFALALERRNVRGVAAIADGRPWHAGGASEAQELAAALAAYVFHLRLLDGRGVAVDRAIERILIALAADADQFLTIAKMRTMRLLHTRLLEAIGADYRPCRIHAETAWRMMSRRDARVNILRANSAAFAAGVGGADSIAVLPFTAALEETGREAHRLARNTQNILLAEAHLGRVADPGAGAGAIEALTRSLAAAAWQRFRAIEAAGGMLAAIRDGVLQREISATRLARRRRAAHREIGLVGTNLFLDPDEVAHEPAPARKPVVDNGAPAEKVEPLVAERIAEHFEREADPTRGAM